METSRSDNKSDRTDLQHQQHPSPTWRVIVPRVQWRSFWFDPETLKGAQEMIARFRPLPSDIILASFLKTDTTWLKALLYLITNRSSSKQSLVTTRNPHMLVPQLELHIYGPDPQDHTSFPGSTMSSNNARLMVTHVPYQILDDNVYSSNCRVVYITRNPKDAVVSLWRLINKTVQDDEEQIKLEYVVDKFCDGTLPYGPYYDHVLGYWTKSLYRPEKVCFVTYEELQVEPVTQVKRLADFLRRSLGTDKETEEVIRSCSTERLTEKVGDYTNYMSLEMIQKIDRITKQNFHASGLIYGV